VALGAVSFLLVYAGLVPTGTPRAGETPKEHGAVTSGATADFVALSPLLVSIHGSEPARQLRFEAYLEVESGQSASVENLKPRIMDVMNSYLRAIEMHDVRDPAALMRIRAQLLRRIQIVTGEGRVRDLLVTTFLIN